MTSARGTILVVDDEPAILDIFRETLEPEGYSVVACDSAAKAAAEAAKTKFDLIYLDLNMPDMSGDEIVKTLRELQPGVFVIVVTGFPDDPRIARMFADGAFMCVAKPIYPTDIIRMTQDYVSLREGA